MKNNLLFLLFILMLASACQSQENKQAENNSSEHPQVEAAVKSVVLAPGDFEAQLAKLGDVQLVDVRTPGEVANGALPNAINIDFKAADFKEQMAKLDPNKPVFVYCQGGVRSAKAATVCKELGYKEIYDLEGGFGNWSKYKAEKSH